MNPYNLNLNIKLAFYTHFGHNVPVKFQGVLSSIDHLILSGKDKDDSLTKVKVILEGLYQAVSENPDLKKQLVLVRNDVWRFNCGTPSQEFLQLYRKQISQTITSVNNLYWCAYNHNDYSVNLTDLTVKYSNSSHN